MTKKQKRFCDEYLVDLNATQAAIRAGYSQKTARAIAAENLTKPDIQKCVEKRRQDMAQESRVTVQRIVQELAKGAFCQLSIKDFRAADKLKCLELLGKYLGMFSGELGKEKHRPEEANKRISEALKKIWARMATDKLE